MGADSGSTNEGRMKENSTTAGGPCSGLPPTGDRLWPRPRALRAPRLTPIRRSTPTKCPEMEALKCKNKIFLFLKIVLGLQQKPKICRFFENSAVNYLHLP